MNYKDIENSRTTLAKMDPETPIVDQLSWHNKLRWNLVKQFNRFNWWLTPSPLREIMQTDMQNKSTPGDYTFTGYQDACGEWFKKCFGNYPNAIQIDKKERMHRFLEEALEYCQSREVSALEAMQLVTYVYGREIGDPKQELGGVMITLAVAAAAHNDDLSRCAIEELDRVNQPHTIEKIRAKDKVKPKFSPLPGSVK